MRPHIRCSVHVGVHRYMIGSIERFKFAAVCAIVATGSRTTPPILPKAGPASLLGLVCLTFNRSTKLVHDRGRVGLARHLGIACLIFQSGKVELGSRIRPSGT